MPNAKTLAITALTVLAVVAIANRISFVREIVFPVAKS